MADWVDLTPPHPVTRSNDEHGFTTPVICTRAEYDRIAAIPVQYRTAVAPVTSADVVEMDQAARDAVDAAAAVAADDAEMAKLDIRDVLSAFALLVLDELNTHAATTTAILDAVDGANNLGQLKTDVALIADLPQRTVGQLKTAIRNKLESL